MRSSQVVCLRERQYKYPSLTVPRYAFHYVTSRSRWQTPVHRVSHYSLDRQDLCVSRLITKSFVAAFYDWCPPSTIRVNRGPRLTVHYIQQQQQQQQWLVVASFLSLVRRVSSPRQKVNAGVNSCASCSSVSSAYELTGFSAVRSILSILD